MLGWMVRIESARGRFDQAAPRNAAIDISRASVIRRQAAAVLQIAGASTNAQLDAASAPARSAGADRAVLSQTNEAE